MAAGYLLPSAVLLIAVFSQGDGLSCWMCSSDKMSQQFCRDPFNISVPFVYARDCSGILQQPPPRPGYQHYCVKLVIRPQYGWPVTHRMCMWGPQINPQAEICASTSNAAFDTIEQCHVCSTTGCNGSPARLPRQPLGSLLTLLGWLVLRS